MSAARGPRPGTRARRFQRTGSRNIPAELHQDGEFAATAQSGPARFELLAHELHDSIAAQLGFLAFEARRIESLICETGEAAPLMTEMRTVLGRLQKQVRELITGARIGMQGLSLRDTLADAVQEFSRHSGIVFELDNRLAPGVLPADHELQVLQVVREALANVVRHSHATQVRIELRQFLAACQVVVEDNGIGMNTHQTPSLQGHYGLDIMRERALAIGATLAIGSVTPSGVRMTLRIPVRC
ncbi:ATP-binding protein (plasmid) [Cupriavidus metallidurans]|uniref:sensor histidine kinase n=1 Tax=Cupriavidus metallidurans TaxID=119219 RepID=UPI003D752B91